MFSHIHATLRHRNESTTTNSMHTTCFYEFGLYFQGIPDVLVNLCYINQPIDYDQYYIESSKDQQYLTLATL